LRYERVGSKNISVKTKFGKFSGTLELPEIKKEDFPCEYGELTFGSSYIDN
jgi:hypothetical protein